MKHLKTFELYSGEDRTIGFRYSDREQLNYIDIAFSPDVDENHIDVINSVVDEYDIPVSEIQLGDDPNVVRVNIKSYSDTESLGMLKTLIKGITKQIPLDKIDLASDINKPEFKSNKKIGF